MYPMTYEEYEQKIIKLYLKMYPKEKHEQVKQLINNSLKKEPNLIRSLYGDTCFRYNHHEIYCAPAKKYSRLLAGINTL